MRHLWLPALLLALATSAPAQAGFIVTPLGPTTIQAGDTAHIFQFVLGSDTASALLDYNFDAVITPSSGSSSLIFASVTAITEATADDPNYVFAGNSIFDGPQYDLESPTSLNATDYANTPVTVTGSQVLVNLVLDASAAVAGHTFTLTLQNIYLSDADGNFYTLDDVTTQLDVVPEPSTLVLSGFGALMASMIAWRRRNARAA